MASLLRHEMQPDDIINDIITREDGEGELYTRPKMCTCFLKDAESVTMFVCMVACFDAVRFLYLSLFYFFEHYNCILLYD